MVCRPSYGNALCLTREQGCWLLSLPCAHGGRPLRGEHALDHGHADGTLLNKTAPAQLWKLNVSRQHTHHPTKPPLPHLISPLQHASRPEAPAARAVLPLPRINAELGPLFPLLSPRGVHLLRAIDPKGTIGIGRDRAWLVFGRRRRIHLDRTRDLLTFIRSLWIGKHTHPVSFQSEITSMAAMMARCCSWVNALNDSNTPDSPLAVVPSPPPPRAFDHAARRCVDDLGCSRCRCCRLCCCCVHLLPAAARAKACELHGERSESRSSSSSIRRHVDGARLRTISATPRASLCVGAMD